MSDHYEAVARAAAKKLKLLNAAGDLVKVDSLNMIDLVTEIEESSQISIPTSSLLPERFASISTLSALLREVAAR